MEDKKAKIQNIFDLYDKHGQEPYIGEKVSQLQHAQQCSQEALRAGQPDHAVLGAFLHDVGHLIGLENNLEPMKANDGIILGTKTHEKVGEDFLKGLGFPKNVTDFVRGHVDAKRYLVFKYVFLFFNISR
jgi:predicted HD phosphohydrolase